MNKNFLHLNVILLLTLFIASCSSGGKTGGRASVEFPKVDVPAMVTDQKEVVKFVVLNYWNKFLDSTRVSGYLGGAKDTLILGIDSIRLETAFGEYAYYLNMLQTADNATTSYSVRKLLDKADKIAQQGDSSFLFRMVKHCEHYFYDPNSPVLNEELYIPTLEGIMASKTLTELDKMQYEYQLRICNLNRVGAVASDFEYSRITSAVGKPAVVKKEKLSGIKGENILVFFNSPDCPTCTEFKDVLKGDPRVQELVKSGKLTILAIYIEDKLEMWREHRGTYPMEWIYAYDHTFTLKDNQLYALRAIPSLYLLDKDKKVVFKDANIDKAMAYLMQIK